MSPGDAPREMVDDIATVLALAALTTDRTRGEQKALERLAERVDKRRNRQSVDSPWWPILWRRAAPSEWPVCTYSPPPATEHPKSCVCRGDGRAVEPEGGWSRLVEVVEP